MKINKSSYVRCGSAPGFSLFEVMVVIFVISILGVVALDYYYKILVDVERTSMMHDLGAMRSAVSMQVAKAYASRNGEDLRGLVGTNPVELLKEKPENYSGAVSGENIDKVEKGTWFFDPEQGSLNYLVRNQLYFETSVSGSVMARFRIEPTYIRSDSAAVKKISGLEIKALEPYHWIRPWN